MADERSRTTAWMNQPSGSP